METVGSREVYANRWMRVREDDIRRADGSDGIYGVVDKPDFALIIPAEDDRLHLVQQFRYPLQRRSWEFPQGTAPNRAHRPPEELAAAELKEETGMVADAMTPLGRIDLAPGLSSQRGQVFLATGLTAGAHQREHEEQDMRTAWFGRAEVERMIAVGEISDAQSLAAFALLLLHERRERR